MVIGGWKRRRLEVSAVTLRGVAVILAGRMVDGCMYARTGGTGCGMYNRGGNWAVDRREVGM